MCVIASDTFCMYLCVTDGFCCMSYCCSISLLFLLFCYIESARVGVCVYLIGLCIIWTLRVLGLFDILYHLPKKGMTVVLILGHQHFQHEPQASTSKTQA